MRPYQECESVKDPSRLGGPEMRGKEMIECAVLVQNNVTLTILRLQEINFQMICLRIL